jgi:hypothetical protein
MDQPAEPVPAQNLEVRAMSGLMRMPGRRILSQRPVRPVTVVVIGVLAEDQPQAPLAGDIGIRSRRSRRALTIHRSAIASGRGARTGVLMLGEDVPAGYVLGVRGRVVRDDELRGVGVCAMGGRTCSVTFGIDATSRRSTGWFATVSPL